MSHSLWEQALKGYVHNGHVDYGKLKADPGLLEKYIKSLEDVQAGEYEAWSREDKIAAWINAYNAMTVRIIVANYPIKPSWTGSLRYPKNSIRQIPGVWNKLKFHVLGRDVTLDDIEHEILRQGFHEPKAHMALVCASVGCPPLRAEAYTGDKLEAQLDDQVRVFLGSEEKFKIDRASGVVYLSPIFNWFGGDFIKSYTPARGFNGYGPSEKASLNFIARHLNEPDRDYLAGGKFKVKYLDYDWSLNEQK